MRSLILSLALACFATVARAQENLYFSSTNHRWVVTARWNVTHGGYLFDLRDRYTGKLHFARTDISADEALPRRFSAIWSPDGRRVALNFYYGRIAQGVAVIDVSGKQPIMLPLASTPSDFDDFQQVATRWRSGTDLEVSAWYTPVHQTPAYPALSTDYSLVVRFSPGKSTIVQRVALPSSLNP